MKVSHTKFNNSVGREFVMKQHKTRVAIDDLEWPSWHSDEEERARTELRAEYGADVIEFEFDTTVADDDDDEIEIYASAPLDKYVYEGLSSKICMDLSIALAEHIERELGVDEVDCPDEWVEFNHLNNTIEFAFIVLRE